ncbi:hypothetical protein C0R05_12875 [Streptomyces albidoflavus]|nr:hypothetical protein C0R05_12875 [Streptomyces albidoflavus]
MATIATRDFGPVHLRPPRPFGVPQAVRAQRGRPPTPLAHRVHADLGRRRGHRPHQPLASPRIDRHHHRRPRPSPTLQGQRSWRAATAPARMGPCRRTPRNQYSSTCASV